MASEPASPSPNREDCRGGQKKAHGSVEDTPNESSFFQPSGAGTLVSFAAPGGVSGAAEPAAVSGEPQAFAIPGLFVFPGLLFASVASGLFVVHG